MPTPWPRRRGAVLLLAAAVTAVHLWLGEGVFEARLGEGAAGTAIRRMDVAFVRELAPTAPAPVAAAAAEPPRRARPPRRPAPVAPAASAAASAPPAPALAASEPPPEVAQAAPEAASAASAPESARAASAPASTPAIPPPAVAEAASAAASAPAAAPFEWPASTRLSYALSGYFRGDVQGSGQVEWLHADSHYQVRLEVIVGPSFAPLVARRFVSDGQVGEHGLSPERFDEETKIAFRAPRVTTIRFDGQRLTLPDGRVLPQPPGVQDTASQFVQMTYLFTTRPELLQPGRTIEFPLALNRSLSVWTYDVVGRETLATPFGALETVHVKPRREPKPGSEMTVELWIAPTLQYLPVKCFIRADAETWAEMTISRLPQQAAPAAASAPGR